MSMTRFRTALLVVIVLVLRSGVVSAQNTDEKPKKKLEFPSPDGRFAFRYAGSEAEDEKQTYELIEKASKKAIKTVAESDPDMGPSARFVMKQVQWRSDSKAFALNAFLWKRGYSLFVFVREGSTFREIELPQLVIDIPDTAKKGKNFDHIVELDSTTAKKWQKDGSLLVEIETIVDGEGGSLSANRTVVLGFDNSAKAKILKSTVKFALNKE
jgi:hypothetical protein